MSFISCRIIEVNRSSKNEMASETYVHSPGLLVYPAATARPIALTIRPNALARADRMISQFSILRWS
jgi:hypothetical protein